MGNGLKTPSIRFFIENQVLTKIKGSSQKIEVPEGVVEIEHNVFSGRKGIKKIVFPESLKVIKDGFRECTALKEVVLPNHEVQFENSEGTFLDSRCLADENDMIVFAGQLFACFTEKEEIALPQYVKIINSHAFTNCPNLKKVVLGNHIEKVYDSAFYMEKAHKDAFMYHFFPKKYLLIECDDKWGRDHLNELYNALDMHTIPRAFFNGEFDLSNDSVMSKIFKKWIGNKSSRKFLTEFFFDAKLFGPLLNLGRKFPQNELNEWITKATSEKKTDLLAALLEYENKYYPATLKDEGDALSLELEEMPPEEAAEKDWKQIFQFTKKSKEITISAWRDSGEILRIPSEIEGCPVVSIGSCFYRKSCELNPEASKLREVILPDSVKRILSEAFSDAKNLERINIEHVTDFGRNVFSNCRHLQDDQGFTILGDILFDYIGTSDSVRVPEGIKRIGARAFAFTLGDLQKTPIKEIILPGSLTEIGAEAFRSSFLEKIDVPETVEKIGQRAFADNGRLVQVNLPVQLTEISNGLFERCKNLSMVNFPPGLRKIGDNAFSECVRASFSGFESLDELVEIGEHAFAASGIETAELPKQVSSLGRESFGNCWRLKRFSCGSAMNVIPEKMLMNCSVLETVNLSDSITSIENRAFAGTGILTLTIGKKAETIGNFVLAECCKLTNLYIGSDDVEMGTDILKNCSGVDIHVHRGTFADKWAKRYAKSKGFNVIYDLE